MPNLLDLPTELLIHIFSDLYHIVDFGSCSLTCHRLRDIIQNSPLIQYLIRTALAGVYDPFLPSGPPPLDRLELLKRWSATWQEPSAHLRSPSRILVHRTELNADFLLRDDYLVVVDFGRRHGPRRGAGYEWLDLRKPGDDWTNIRFEENLVPLAFALDVTQQDLLAGLFGCPETASFQLRLLGFHDGSPHLLAPRPFLDIPLPTKEVHSIGLKIRMSMIGPYIVIAAGLPPTITGMDILLLVEWQKGHVTELRRTHTRTYPTDLLVLSDHVLALVHGPGNAIELCRVSTTPTASLQTIRRLGLPPLLPHARLVASSFKTENNPTAADMHHRRSRSRPPPRYPFSPSQADSLVLLTLSARRSGLFANTRTYTLVAHARTLLSYAPSPPPDASAGIAAVPWDAWGPHATRCFEGHAGATSAVATGQRWLKRGTIRDFCPRRLRWRWARAAGAGDALTSSPSSLPANGVFAHDIVSALPYREVRLAMGDNDDVLVDDALVDRERVTFFVPGPSKDEFAFHVHAMG